MGGALDPWDSYKIFLIRTKSLMLRSTSFLAVFVRLFSYLLHSEARCVGTRMLWWWEAHYLNVAPGTRKKIWHSFHISGQYGEYPVEYEGGNRK